MTARPLSRCPDCAAQPGAPHHAGCDVERCPECGGQRLSCGCDSDLPHTHWTGTWPGHLECREFGWFVKWDGKRWHRCSVDDPLASPDLTRLETEAIWDKSRGRYVLPNASQEAK